MIVYLYTIYIPYIRTYVNIGEEYIPTYVAKFGEWLFETFEPVCRNGTYVRFLHTKEWYVHIIALYEETIRRTISSSLFLCTKKQCIYLLFLHTKKWYVCIIASYVCTIFHTIPLYEETVATYIPFLHTKKL